MHVTACLREIHVQELFSRLDIQLSPKIATRLCYIIIDIKSTHSGASIAHAQALQLHALTRYASIAHTDTRQLYNLTSCIESRFGKREATTALKVNGSQNPHQKKDS